MNMEYPFAAIIGQPRLLLALKLLAISPQLGGLLISGEKGTAKSTAARSLSTVLDSPYINMPLGITEDRLLGTIDIENLLQNKTHSFSPGLLSKAHGGILYVDEINLLPDRLVDVLLDTSVSGVNYVERDGISHQHDSKFILIGTMNADEGELRPQLKDRFGLSLSVNAPKDPNSRVDIVRERMSFEKDKKSFIEKYQDKQLSIREHLKKAKSILPNVSIPSEWQVMISQSCIDANVEGLRADLTWYAASQAHAALNHRILVEEQDVLAVKEFVLDHRRKDKKTSEEPPPSPPKAFQRPPSQKPEKTQKQSQQNQQQQMNSFPDSHKNGSSDGHSQGSWGEMDAETTLNMNHDELDDTVVAVLQGIFDVRKTPSTNRHIGIESHFQEKTRSGKPLIDSLQVRSLGQAERSQAINWHQSILRNTNFNELVFHPTHSPMTESNLIILDTSGSATNKTSQSFSRQMVSLINQLSYLYRQKLAVLSFGQSSPRWLMTLQKPYKMVSDYLPQISFGGGTPLTEALSVARKFIATYGSFKTFLVTDGRIKNNVEIKPWPQKMWVIDTESSRIPLGRSKVLAEQLEATYIKL